MEKTLGGDRLGSGNNMKVEMRNFERSSHNLGKIWRSTMSAGTIVPCYVNIALPGDTWEIDIDLLAKTLPPIAPVFGSFKIQVDAFLTPWRLYNRIMYNNSVGYGTKMDQVLLPKITLYASQGIAGHPDIDNSQVEPSTILSYLGIRGIGVNLTEAEPVPRDFNGLFIINYYDIVKNYYCNQMEKRGFIIHTPVTAPVPVDEITVNEITFTETDDVNIYLDWGAPVTIQFSTDPDGNYTGAQFGTTSGWFNIVDCIKITSVAGNTLTGTWDISRTGPLAIYGYRTTPENEIPPQAPRLQEFELQAVDELREVILAQPNGVAFDASNWIPISFTTSTDPKQYLQSQQGLALKTYQSDMFNNWLDTEWIDTVNTLSQVDTASGSFSIDALAFAEKLWKQYNRIVAAGNTFNDWNDAVFAHEGYKAPTSPMYMGGLSKELVFGEVISNADATPSEGPAQPLGTLGGVGRMGNKHKGGKIIMKVDEISTIMIMVSITPRLDYSQGNKWYNHLRSVADVHTPQMDQIGFQDMIEEDMAWWSTGYTAPDWLQRSAGKQPAWLKYMTDVNETKGNFAIKNNQMFMTINRRYEYDPVAGIKDMTTYVDPVKYNYLFAQNDLTAQNFWMQIAFDITARRKMSAKIMPNL